MLSILVALAMITGGFAVLFPFAEAGEPMNVTTSNITPTSFTVTWETPDNDQCNISWDTDPAFGSPDGNTSLDGPSYTHSHDATDLTPSTTYYFRIWSQNDGVWYTDPSWKVTTPASGSTPDSYSVYGTIYEQDGSTPADNVIVIISIGGNNYSAVTDSNGHFVIDTYGATGSGTLTARGGPLGRIEGQSITITGSGSPENLGDFTLGPNPPASLVMVPDTVSVSADGTSTITFDIWLNDTFGAGVTGEAANISVIIKSGSNGGGSVGSVTEVDASGDPGHYQVVYTAGTYAPATDIVNATYTPNTTLTDESTVTLTEPHWYLLASTSISPPMEDLSLTPGPDPEDTKVLQITAPGWYKIGTWTSPVLNNTDPVNVSGTWTYHLYIENATAGGWTVNASVFASNDLTTHLESGSSVTLNAAGKQTYEWTDTVNGTIPAGERVVVEFWLHADALPTQYTYADTAGEITVTTGWYDSSEFPANAGDDGASYTIAEENVGSSVSVTNYTNATSQGSGDSTGDSLNDIYLNDSSGAGPSGVSAGDGWYTVDKGKVLSLTNWSTDAFGASDTVTACVLKMEYGVESGYTGNNEVLYWIPGGASGSTGIKPTDTSPNNFYAEFDLLAANGGSLTISQIHGIFINFTNNDGPPNDAVNWDFMWIYVEAQASVANYSMDVEIDVNNVPAGSGHQLQYNVTNVAGDSENINVELWDGTTWNVIDTLNDSLSFPHTYTKWLTAGEYNGGNVRLRLVDAEGDGTNTTVDFDYVRVETFSNVTLYYDASAGSGSDSWLSFPQAPGRLPPSTSVDAISPYWQPSSPITINATATSDADAVELYYRYSSDNSTWGAWTLFGNDTNGADGWSWSFNFPNGTGYYEFYSLGWNGSGGGWESPPGTADALCGYDGTAPTSSVDAISPYWQNTSPITITYTASDGTSGLANVSLYYSYSSDNITWSSWTYFDHDLDPWTTQSFSFTFPDGEGWYNFTTKAIDNATNEESLPSLSSPDAYCGYDITAPTSSADPISPYVQTTLPITINATASDALSGVASVELWYRYSSDNSTWDAWVLFGTDTASPWSWSFDFPNGTGYYEFYSIGHDVAGNVESAPATNDTLCQYAPGTTPSSAVDAISPYWQNTSPITITATASSSADAVDLYYRYSNDNATWGSWTEYANDTNGADGWSWSFNFPNGTGYYEFYSLGWNGSGGGWESPPGTADALCGYDGTAPTSSVDAISPYWQNTSPITITYTASDGTSGLANVSLYYSYSSDNITWSSWTYFDHDLDPWTTQSFSFTFPDGEGWYNFTTKAIDNATNEESLPSLSSPDAYCGYDATAPTSSVDAISPYWQTSSPVTITATASDNLAGVRNVSLYYRYSSDNSTWGSWTLFGTDTTSGDGWSWSFTFPDGEGYYEFYSIATDNASNAESKSTADASCAYDKTAPTSSVDAISPYWQNTSPITITYTASDGTSGLANVSLYYSYSSDNITWSSWTYFDHDLDPWTTQSFSFTFPDGEGWYNFTTKAIDNATNEESLPSLSSPDAYCGYDITAPTSSADPISPYVQSTSPITINATASDDRSGVADVELWYRYSTDNSTWDAWTLFGTDTAAPWSWSFDFPNGTGYYEFYTRAHDNGGNYEAAPPTNDTLCQYTVSSAEVASTIHFEPGWNLISLDVHNSTQGHLNASQLADAITAAGGTPKYIVHWDAGSGSYDITYSVASGSTDFQMDVGYGYWVYLDTASSAVDATIYGLNKTAMGTMTFKYTAGAWNLIGWFNTTNIQASAYIDLVNDTYYNGMRGYITDWDEAAQAYGTATIQQYDSSTGSKTTHNDQTMYPKQGYWMWLKSQTQVTY